MGKDKPIIGVTGAIGAGKTTVARELGKLGCAVISADSINHQVLDEAAVVEQVRQWWGDEVMGSDGKIDRKALGNIVFEDKGAMKKLTDLVHPRVDERQRALIREHQADQSTTAIVLDVPLLFEIGQQGLCDFVVFVGADDGLRLERLAASHGWDRERVKKIENSQLELDIKARMSDHRLDNNSTISILASQVAKIFSLMLETRAARRSRVV